MWGKRCLPKEQEQTPLAPFGRPGGAPLPQVRVPKPAGRSRPPGYRGYSADLENIRLASTRAKR